MGNDDRPLSEYLADLPKMYSTPEIRIDCPDTLKFDVVERLTDYYRKRYKVIDIDGVRVVLEGGWGLVRPSNTGPILVLRFEATTEDGLKKIQDMVTGDLTRIMEERRTH